MISYQSLLLSTIVLNDTYVVLSCISDCLLLEKLIMLYVVQIIHYFITSSMLLLWTPIGNGTKEARASVAFTVIP